MSAAAVGASARERIRLTFRPFRPPRWGVWGELRPLPPAEVELRESAARPEITLTRRELRLRARETAKGESERTPSARAAGDARRRPRLRLPQHDVDAAARLTLHHAGEDEQELERAERAHGGSRAWPWRRTGPRPRRAGIAGRTGGHGDHLAAVTVDDSHDVRQAGDARPLRGVTRDAERARADERGRRVRAGGVGASLREGSRGTQRLDRREEPRLADLVRAVEPRRRVLRRDVEAVVDIERPDAGHREVEERGPRHLPGAHHVDARRPQELLRDGDESRQDELARVARDLGVGEGHV